MCLVAPAASAEGLRGIRHSAARCASDRLLTLAGHSLPGEVSISLTLENLSRDPNSGADRIPILLERGGLLLPVRREGHRTFRGTKCFFRRVFRVHVGERRLWDHPHARLLSRRWTISGAGVDWNEMERRNVVGSGSTNSAAGNSARDSRNLEPQPSGGLEITHKSERGSSKCPRIPNLDPEGIKACSRCVTRGTSATTGS